jgi:hypothetical protein
MVAWYWMPILLFAGLLIGFVGARIADKKLDAMETRIGSKIDALKK